MRRRIIILFILFILLLLTSLYVYAGNVNESVSNLSANTIDSGTIVYNFGNKVLIISYFIYLVICLYFKFYGIRQIQAMKYGGIVNEKNVNYTREKPKSINIEIAFTSLYYCSNIKKSKLKNGIIGAYLLKWSNENKILITDNGNKIYNIDLKDGDFFKPEIEQELYDMLKEAAGNNNTIDTTEFKIWYKAHSDVLDKWYYKILSKSKNISLKPIAEYLLGLKKYLLDYSLIEERRHIEIKLWEEYLTYAQIMGISDEVNKEFNDIYPDYSKTVQLIEMELGEAAFRLMLIYLFFLIPLAFAIPTTIIISIGNYLFFK